VTDDPVVELDSRLGLGVSQLLELLVGELRNNAAIFLTNNVFIPVVIMQELLHAKDGSCLINLLGLWEPLVDSQELPVDDEVDGTVSSTFSNDTVTGSEKG